MHGWSWRAVDWRIAESLASATGLKGFSSLYIDFGCFVEALCQLAGPAFSQKDYDHNSS